MTQYIKITNKGKVSMALPHHLKYTFKQLLEMAMNNQEREPLTIMSAPDKIIIALIDEVYRKYHTQLSLLRGDTKILLTLAQAHALWAMCQQYDQNAYVDASMGGILMQLHQKLS